MEAEAAKVGKGLNEWWAAKPSMVGVFRGTRVGGVKVQVPILSTYPSSGYTGARLHTFSLC